MCGIIGIFGKEDSLNKIKEALAVMKNRGKDGFGISNGQEIICEKKLEELPNIKGKNLVAHNLHAIVGHVSQPINGKGILAANCEIYNWEELNEKYSLNAKNDAELLLKLLDKYSLDKLDELDGVYAFAYWNNDQVIIARDLVGVKPVWYSNEGKSFAFASEKKSLKKIGYNHVRELSPRLILEYDIKENKVKFTNRKFFSYLPEHKDNFETIKERTSELLSKSIEKRIPNKKFGLLFSGGIDSTYLAHYFKRNNHDFTCYTAALEGETKSRDLICAQKIAKEMGFKLKVKTIKIEEVEKYLKKIVPLIEDSKIVKVGVALTFYLACELAKKDGCKVIFSGLGSEEIFAGYERHKSSGNINQECVSGLIQMYERDLYRDDVVTMDNHLELRIPFLDRPLIEYCLKIPEKYKIAGGESKLILRQISEEQGLPKEYAFRKKLAAQYGSRFDNALGRLARRNGFKLKADYVRQFYPEPNLKLGVLFSSGKDSTYSAYIMKRQNYELTCLITIKSKNEASYMFHTPAIDLAKLQAEAMGIPIIMQETEGEKEKELIDLKKALKKAKDQFNIDGIITGAVFSTYQRDRVERICDSLGLKIFSPLWHKPQEQLMQELLDTGFEIIFTGIAAEGLNKSWLNKVITTEHLLKLKKLKEKIGMHEAGEGGEFESLVLDCPLFKKKVVIKKAKIIEEKENVARLEIVEAELVEK
jgi:diphthine-ammonia ligase